MIRRSPVTDVHARKVGAKTETAGICCRKPRYEKFCRVTINAFEMLERSAVKVARSALMKALSGNWLCLSNMFAGSIRLAASQMVQSSSENDIGDTRQENLDTLSFFRALHL